MGRPPCCDKIGIKKGPWTPEEDIILVSYIQEHGPGNWRSVPTNTGLLRCSKSCRLRWTNYLRPGIKRGNFTLHEEGMIIHLQALLGNKWAAIASYLPQRTDNDIKNYWNTHLKKKMKKFQPALDPEVASTDSKTSCQLVSRSFGEKRSVNMSNQASVVKLNQTSTYASSTENISRLLEGWMKTSPKGTDVNSLQEKQDVPSSMIVDYDANLFQHDRVTKIEQDSCNHNLISHEEEDFESLLSLQNVTSICWDKYSSSDSTLHGSQTTPREEKFHSMSDNEGKLETHPPLSLLEKWLLDEASGQVEGIMELSPISDSLPNV